MKSRLRELDVFEWLIIITILLLNAFVLFTHENYFITWFNSDDAFYYFKTAQNLTEGRGLSFDGFEPTNGFHPLWMMVVIPIFALARFDLILPLQILFVILTLLNVGSSLLLYRLLRRMISKPVAFLAAFVWAFYHIINEVTARGGTEGGINAFFLILLLYWLGKSQAKSPRQALVLGWIASLTFLARLDNIFVVGCIGLWVVFFWGRAPRDSETEAGSEWRRRFDLARAYFTPLASVVLVYMLINQLAFGTPTPVSGQVKRWWATLEQTPYGQRPASIFALIKEIVTYSGDTGPWAIITGYFFQISQKLQSVLGLEASKRMHQVLTGVLLALAGGISATFMGFKHRKFALDCVRDLGMVPFMLGLVLQIGYYKVGGQIGQRDWYWVGEMLMAVLAMAVLFEGVYRTLSSRSVGRYLAYLLVAAAAYQLIGLPVARVRKSLRPDIASIGNYYREREQWLAENTEPGAIIGMTGSGSAGYFAQDHLIINLDGLISSPAYFQRMKDGTADEYLASIGLDYVFGKEYMILERDPYRDIFTGKVERQSSWTIESPEMVLWRFLP